jgi:hypothetical protein
MDFLSLTAEFDVANEFKNQSRKEIFNIFLSPYAAMSFWGTEKTISHYIGATFSFLQMGQNWCQESIIVLYTDFKNLNINALVRN